MATPYVNEERSPASEGASEAGNAIAARTAAGLGRPVAALPPDNEMWVVANVAQFLKRSESWVYKKSSAGVLPVHRLDGWGLRFVPAEIRAWAQRQTRAGR